MQPHERPLHECDATAIADGIRAGELKAIEVLEHHLERIDRHNAPLNAFVHLDPDRAMAAATDVDRRVAAGDDPGPFAGVPLGIKELESVEGWPETHAST